METVNFNDFKEQINKEQLKRKVKTFAKEAKEKAGMVANYCVEHPVEALSIVSAASVGLNRFYKYKQTKAEDRRREVDFYDNRLGTHAIARRPLTMKEALEVERRYKNGESYKSILWDMRLMK